VLRVLLREAGSLELAAWSAPLRVNDGRGRTLLSLPIGERLSLRASDSGVEAVRVAASGEERPVRLPLREIWVDPEPERPDDSLFVLQRRSFRGRLLVRFDGSTLQAINHIGLESYLPSVVGSEMPATWPQEALRAQAVAARTYALRQRRPGAPFDLRATVASQVYKGLVSETSATRAAVASTRSQVLMHGNGLIDAVFHASSGGSTENSGEIWSRQLPYLVSVPDFDEQSPVREWEKRFSPAELAGLFPETGGVRRIEPIETSTSGRLRRARVIGPSGQLVLSGADLRRRLKLRSTLVRFVFEEPKPGRSAGTLAAVLPGGVGHRSGGGSRTLLASAPASGGRDASGGRSVRSVMERPDAAAPSLPALTVLGRGYGHGVGMSQWGAYAMALRGESYEEILRHFYRGVELRPYPSR
jgi:stage II sporulation protein D